MVSLSRREWGQLLIRGVAQNHTEPLPRIGMKARKGACG